MVERGGGIYCSRECRKNRIDCECVWCGKKFFAIESVVENGGGKFCSTECYGKWQSQNRVGENHHQWDSDKARCECVRCKKVFYLTKTRIGYGDGTYCSRKCTRNRVKVNCTQCNKEFEIIASHISTERGNFCNQKCYGDWRSENMRGEKSNWWKGGRRKKYKLIRCPERFKMMALACGRVLVHRLVVAKALGRCLLSEEIVHHVDEDKFNNNIENLWLFASLGDHARFHCGDKSVEPIWKGKSK